MTIEEAAQVYGVKATLTLVGDNELFLSRRLYGSDNALYISILRTLNPWVMWVGMPAGERIVYLDPSVVSNNLK